MRDPWAYGRFCSRCCCTAQVISVFTSKCLFLSHHQKEYYSILPFHPQNMVVGACTEVIAGEGLILTAGALDTHVHFICPQLAREALASGITSLIGGGTGPATGTNATTCTPGAAHIKLVLLIIT